MAFYDDAISTTPSATIMAAERRIRIGRSLNQRTPIIAASITDVSRTAATKAKGASVFAKSANP